MVSEIKVSDVASYIRLSELTSEDETLLATLIEVAKKFIMDYTGVSDLDKHEDFTIVVYILVQDMYDNRTLHVDNNNLNKVVTTILGLHSINNL